MMLLSEKIDEKIDVRKIKIEKLKKENYLLK